MTKLKKLILGRIKNSQDDLVDQNNLEKQNEFLSDDDIGQITESKNSVMKQNQETDQEWLDEDLEGQLSVDVFQNKDNVIIKSTIAGVKPEDIDIDINNDMITIKGKREAEYVVKKDDYFYQECYWGNFSRSIILPVEVKADKTDAELKNGILTITIPKAKASKAISVKVKSE